MSWAIPPKRVSTRIARVDGKDVLAHQDRNAVRWLLTKQKDNQNLTAYYDQVESEFVDEGDEVE